MAIELKCPVCQSRMTRSAGVFYERGEFDGKNYEEEGDVDAYKCSNTECEAEIAVIYCGKQG